jgi:hypothetical protein
MREVDWVQVIYRRRTFKEISYVFGVLVAAIDCFGSFGGREAKMRRQMRQDGVNKKSTEILE